MKKEQRLVGSESGLCVSELGRLKPQGLAPDLSLSIILTLLSMYGTKISLFLVLHIASRFKINDSIRGLLFQ
jgi:hypothetical protein